MHSNIRSRIIEIRGLRVLLDADLADLYGVTAKRLNEQVRRNRDRFPPDFMIRLTDQEFAILRSQNATSSWGGRRYAPFAFGEHGALMAAMVLNSPRAMEVSVFVVRAFVALREALRSDSELRAQLLALERRIGTHDRAIAQIFEALRRLTAPPASPSPAPKRRIGFL